MLFIGTAMTMPCPGTPRCSLRRWAAMSSFVLSGSATVMTMRLSFDSMPISSIMLCTAVPRPCMTTVIGSRR